VPMLSPFMWVVVTEHLCENSDRMGSSRVGELGDCKVDSFNRSSVKTRKSDFDKWEF
jgi:hypothetical protein